MTIDRITTVLIILISGIFFALSLKINAQTEPLFLVSWQSDAYAPDDFLGKVFPAPKSVVNVSFEVLEGGRFANLSQNNIRWLINGLSTQGVGQKTTSFTNKKFANDKIEIEISVFDYKTAGNTLIKILEIPVVNPEIVIKAPYHRDELSEKEVNLSALPYFFNISSLKDMRFTWTINNERPVGEPERQDLITVTIPGNAPSGSQFKTEVIAQNTKRPVELAITSLLFQIK